MKRLLAVLLVLLGCAFFAWYHWYFQLCLLAGLVILIAAFIYGRRAVRTSIRQRYAKKRDAIARRFAPGLYDASRIPFDAWREAFEWMDFDLEEVSTNMGAGLEDCPLRFVGEDAARAQDFVFEVRWAISNTRGLTLTETVAGLMEKYRYVSGEENLEMPGKVPQLGSALDDRNRERMEALTYGERVAEIKEILVYASVEADGEAMEDLAKRLRVTYRTPWRYEYLPTLAACAA